MNIQKQVTNLLNGYVKEYKRLIMNKQELNKIAEAIVSRCSTINYYDETKNNISKQKSINALSEISCFLIDLGFKICLEYYENKIAYSIIEKDNVRITKWICSFDTNIDKKTYNLYRKSIEDNISI